MLALLGLCIMAYTRGVGSAVAKGAGTLATSLFHHPQYSHPFAT